MKRNEMTKTTPSEKLTQSRKKWHKPELKVLHIADTLSGVFAYTEVSFMVGKNTTRFYGPS